MISELIFKNLLNKTYEKKQEFESSINDLEVFFKPYFKAQITIQFQPSDGFVIVVEFKDDNNAWNLNVKEVLENIEMDQNYYIDCEFLF